MPLDLVKNFGKHEKAILKNVSMWKDTYFQSKSFDTLKGRVNRLKASIDMSFPASKGGVGGQNEFLSKVAFPLVRERYIFRRAVIKRNYRQNPLITIVPVGNTPMENAQNLQDVVNLNFQATRFRERTFERTVDSVARYGAAVTFTMFERSNRIIKRTIPTPYGPRQMSVPEKRALCKNFNVHILNYFQNPRVNDSEDSNIKGFIENISVAELKNLVISHPDSYIKNNLAEVIKEAKNGVMRDENFFIDDKETRDYSRHGVDLSRIWAKLPIDGNEEDDKTYYLEMVGDKIIRFQDNPNDEDICNLTVHKIRHNPMNWWGNTDSEDVMPHENFFNLFMNIKADQAIKELERYIFYPKQALDTAAINSRRVNGGFIPVDVKPGMSLNNMIVEYQGRDANLSSQDWLMREIKESAQKMSTRPDFLRSGNKGGVANNTATAANMLDNLGDYLEEDMLEVFSNGLSEEGRKNAILLIQNLGEAIAVRPDPKTAQREFYKDEMIGQYAFMAESSLQRSTIGEAIRLQNTLTAMINFIGTGIPAFQGIDPTTVARAWIKKLDIGDVDRVMPEQVQNQAGYTPTMQTPGQESAGAVQELPMLSPELQAAA